MSHRPTHRPTAVSKPQRNVGMACDLIKKPKYDTQRSHAADSILACVAFFSIFRVCALHALQFLCLHL